MTAVWQLDLAPSEKLVLLALADNANDQGYCWPSISTIAEKCSMHRATVMRSLSELEMLRCITRSSESGKTNAYTVHPSQYATSRNLQPVAQSDGGGRTVRPVPVAPCDGTSRNLRPRTIIEPSSEPSENRHVCDDFAMEQQLQAEYPKFSGRQDWITAIRAACNLVSDGEATPEDLIAGVKRYAAYVAAGGVSEQRYVMTPAKFFTGADRPWRQEWQPPPKKQTAMERIYAATGGTRVLEHER